MNHAVINVSSESDSSGNIETDGASEGEGNVSDLSENLSDHDVAIVDPNNNNEDEHPVVELGDEVVPHINLVPDPRRESQSNGAINNVAFLEREEQNDDEKEEYMNALKLKKNSSDTEETVKRWLKYPPFRTHEDDAVSKRRRRAEAEAQSSSRKGENEEKSRRDE